MWSEFNRQQQLEMKMLPLVEGEDVRTSKRVVVIGSNASGLEKVDCVVRPGKPLMGDVVVELYGNYDKPTFKLLGDSQYCQWWDSNSEQWRRFEMKDQLNRREEMIDVSKQGNNGVTVAMWDKQGNKWQGLRISLLQKPTDANGMRSIMSVASVRL